MVDNTAATQCTLWNLGSQSLQISFDGGQLVADTGLLTVRALEKPLRVIADLAERLPDPRSQDWVEHSAEAILTQEVYQILAGYPDFNDAQQLRDDPLFQILAEVAPDPKHPLASGSTLARFQYAFTRRQAELPREERPVLLEVREAQTARLKIVNDYLVDLFIRTRRTPPTEIIIDADPTDDPVHGQQTLSSYHGYYRQHQYLPMLIYEGHSGFPLAAWLRPGTVPAGLGASEMVDLIVTKLRAAWPEVVIRVRSDNGLAAPELYKYCEDKHLAYAFGFATNAVLQRRTALVLSNLELYHHFYQHREPSVQTFESIEDYQAAEWSRPRRIIAKIEVTPQGSQRRFVVTNMTDPPEQIYRAFYVQRGRIPEQPIGEMKNGLQADRLSACGFCANAFRLLVHMVAYAIVVLYREALATVPAEPTPTVAAEPTLTVAAEPTLTVAAEPTPTVAAEPPAAVPLASPTVVAAVNTVAVPAVNTGAVAAVAMATVQAAVGELATATVSTLRQRLWKVGARVCVSAKRIWLRVTETWPHADLWLGVLRAIERFVAEVTAGCPARAAPARLG